MLIATIPSGFLHVSVLEIIGPVAQVQDLHDGAVLCVLTCTLENVINRDAKDMLVTHNIYLH